MIHHHEYDGERSQTLDIASSELAGRPGFVKVVLVQVTDASKGRLFEADRLTTRNSTSLLELSMEQRLSRHARQLSNLSHMDATRIVDTTQSVLCCQSAPNVLVPEGPARASHHHASRLVVFGTALLCVDSVHRGLE